MTRFDALGYGTHLILDGFRADAEALARRALIEEVVRELGAQLDRGAVVESLLLSFDDGPDRGLSAALVQGESHLCVHTFPDLHKLSLDAFSARTVPVDAVVSAFRHRFEVGRTESQVHGRGRLLPRTREHLERAVRGDRDYARLRLRDLLSA